MAIAEITITRRSKIGFGYCPWTPEHPEPPSKPDHVGTIRQVLSAIGGDRNYAAYRSGNTYLATAWFVKLGGRWVRAEFPCEGPAILLDRDDQDEYLVDDITALVQV